MKERFISAIIMVLITVPFIILGNIPFACFILLLGEMILFEFLKFRKKIPIIIKIISHIFLGVFILKDLININLETVLIISLFGYLSSLVFIKDNYHYKDAFYLIGLILFIGIALSNLILIRNQNVYLFLYLIMIAVITDSFALFIGKMFGHHKLAPEISPNKTIEGLVGGVLVGTIISSIFYILFIKEINNIMLAIIMSLFLSLIGELGDLIKSTIKRYEKVKDFSNLIPGHGGIMDRVDSLMFIVLMYTLIINLFI